MTEAVRNVGKFVKGWRSGLPETVCGVGSRIGNTKAQREWIPQIIEKYGIKTVADIGAGDLNWIKTMDLSGIDYTAYDLVPRVDGVIKFDLVLEVAPRVDMIMCLWVLNHLPLNDSRNAIANLKASGSKYLMMSDRPSWHCGQPEEIVMPYIEELRINSKGERILLIEL